MKSAIVLGLLSLPSLAMAGNISSGGGELLGDAQNPWFLAHTPEGGAEAPVRYCIEVGPDFIVRRTALETLVKSSFSYWDQSFGSANFPATGLPDNPNYRIRIETTRYIYHADCDDNIDLRFQFGVIGTEQLADLKASGLDPVNFVALAVRTDYSKRMRAKGYIYISPDRGPMAMRAANLIPQIWEVDSNDNSWKHRRLLLTIRHEIGHILGVPHIAGGIMGASALERLVSDDLGLVTQNEPSVFFPRPVNLWSCDRTRNPLLFKLFKVPDDHECITGFTDLRTLRISSSASSSSANDELRRQAGISTYMRRFRSLVKLVLPPEREVFKAAASYQRFLPGPESVDTLQNVTISIDGEPVQVFIQRSQDSVQIGGVVNGKLEPSVYSSGFENGGWTQ
jgi:hypothetical protein